MIEWPKTTINDWSEFDKQIRHLSVGSPYSPPYLFRGQSNSDWSLEPSINRYMTSDIQSESALRIERIAIIEFYSQAHLHISPHIIPDSWDFLGNLALMQHYHAPTRLLDWSRSAYVAAYFAVEQDWEKDGAIWYFHEPTLHLINEEKYGEFDVSGMSMALEEFRTKNFLSVDSPSRIIAFQRRIRSDRMSVQQGAFTICGNVIANHEELIAASLVKNTDKEIFRKLIIPKDVKPQIMRYLRTMNITANSLFPGVDGLGRSTRELMQLEFQQKNESKESH